MVGGMLPGDDGFDPERIERDLERLRRPREQVSDESLKRWILIDSLLREQTNLRLRRQLPGMTAEQEADITKQLVAVGSRLERLLAAEREEP
jgi:hypothetical protein